MAKKWLMLMIACLLMITMMPKWISATGTTDEWIPDVTTAMTTEEYTSADEFIDAKTTSEPGFESTIDQRPITRGNGNVSVWDHCTNVSGSQKIEINTSGTDPIHVGRWTLLRWGFIGNDWMCDLRGRPPPESIGNDSINTLNVTWGPDDQMILSNGQMRCNGANSPSCPPRRCQGGKPTHYCFRLTVSCGCCRNKDAEKRRAEKWIMFGYGTLVGLVLGCIIASVVFMCIDNSGEQSNRA